MKKKILLVDEESEARRSYGEILGSAGYEVLPAASEAEALALLDGARPDVVLLDLLRSGARGLETARTLSARAVSREIPVILVTGEGAVPAGAGFRRFIHKPCRPKTMIEGIEHALRYDR